MKTKTKDMLIAAILVSLCGVFIFLSLMMMNSSKSRIKQIPNSNAQCIEGKLYVIYEHMPFRETRAPVYDENGNHIGCEENKK